VEVFAELRRQYGDAVDMVTHEQNIGYGGALRSGLLAGVETGYDFVAFCDGDGQFDPSEVGKLLDCALLGKLDVVVGYREARADNLVRQMLGKTWHTMQDHLLERTDAIRDVDCGFKLFRREALQRFVQDLAETQAAISPEIMVYVDQHDLRIDEVGVWHGPRLAGKQSGGNPLVAVRSVIGLLRVRRIASATQATQKEMS
jgi:glycosyltransferase involved in cell wall biosynthesis